MLKFKIISCQIIFKLLLGIMFLSTIFSFLSSCTKSNIDNSITEGCIPFSISTSHIFAGIRTVDFIYEDNRLIGYDDDIAKGRHLYDYKGGLISRFTTQYQKYNYYQEFYYKNDSKIARTVQYSQDEPNDDFKKSITDEFIYNGDGKITQIVRKWENLNREETFEFSYYPNTSNVDTVKMYNDDSELVQLDMYEYDDFNTPSINLDDQAQIFYQNGGWWWMENNITFHKVIDLVDSTYSRTIIHELEYNDFRYPIQIKIFDENLSDSLITRIDYTNCE